MAPDMSRANWGKLGAQFVIKPRSAKTVGAASVAGPDEDAAQAVVNNPQVKGKLPHYTVLWPVIDCHDFAAATAYFVNGGSFFVDKRPKPEEWQTTPVADRYNVAEGTIVVLCYGRNGVMQKWYKAG